jgi:hypothetical protein
MLCLASHSATNSRCNFSPVTLFLLPLRGEGRQTFVIMYFGRREADPAKLPEPLKTSQTRKAEASRSGVLTMARGWETVARKAAGPASYWLVLGLIVFVGMTLVIKIEATETRLVLVVVVFAVAFVAASLVEHLLRRREAADGGGPCWYLQLNNPMVYRSSDDAPYSYVVLPKGGLADLGSQTSRWRRHPRLTSWRSYMFNIRGMASA